MDGSPQETPLPRVSVLVPTSNRADSLLRTLDSLAAQDYPRDRFEIVVIDDGSTDHTAETVKRIARRQPDGLIRYEFVPKGHIVHAKNRGLEIATGEIVAFTDDDCTFESDWLRTLVQPFADPEVGAAGGADRAPADSPPLAAAVDYAFTGLLGSGGVRSGGKGARVGRFYPCGCNMAIRKGVLEKTGRFDARFYNGEEIELDYRIIEAGYRTQFQDGARVWHHRRATLPRLARQVFHRGITRRMLFLKHPQFFEPAYFAPALIVAGFVLLALAALFVRPAAWLLALAATGYVALLAAGALHCLVTRRKFGDALRVPAVLIVQHFVYGAGILVAPFTYAHASLRKQCARRGAPRRILISNDGFGSNQGDRAILHVMKADLEARFPGVEIRGFLNSWVPGPRALLRFVRDMRWADVFLLGGGQVLHDQTCFLFLLASLYKLWLARWCGTPAIAYAIGAGPLSFAASRRLARKALSRTELIVVRDESSKRLLEEIGVRGPRIEVTADSAFRLPVAPPERVEEILRELTIPSSRGPLIAICPRRWFHYERAVFPMRWRRKFGGAVPGAERFDELAAAFARLADWLAEELNAAIVLVPMKNGRGRGEPGQDDDAVCWEIAKRCKHSSAVHTLGQDVTPVELKGLLGRMACVVTMRMHAAILSTVQGVPCVGVGLSAKFDDLFRRAEMDRFLVPVESADADGLFRLAKDAMAAGGAQRACPPRLAELVERSRRSVELLRDWVEERYGH